MAQDRRSDESMDRESRDKAIVDPEAERTLLGAILVSPEAWNLASAIVGPADFAVPKHRLLFASMARVWTKTQTIDHVQLKNDLQAREELEAAGGVVYLAELVDGLPRISNLQDWARLLRELRVKRQYLERMAYIRNEILSGYALNEIHEAVSSLSKECLSLSPGRGLVDTDTVLKEAMVELDQEISGIETGVDPGLATLRRNLRGSGWQRGQLIYVGARTSMGKTSLLMTFAVAAAKAGKNVLFFSLEQPPRQLAQKALLREAGIDLRQLRRLQSGACSPEQERAAERLAASFGSVQSALARMTFSDNKPRTIDMMISDALYLRQTDHLDLVVIDYLGYAKLGKKTRSLYEETTEKSQQIKDMASILDLPVICAVQLHRPTDTSKAPPRPTLRSFREAGKIEEDADVAILIHQESSQETIQAGEAELIVAKQRNGWTGICKAWFEATGSWFYDLEHGYTGDEG